jgi:hypothetical protein
VDLILTCVAVPVIRRKFLRAGEESEECSEYLEGLSSSAGEEAVAKWTEEIETAEANRKGGNESMDIMLTKVPKC